MKVTGATLGQVLNKLKTVPVLACDTETTGLEETDRPFALIIADKDTEYYFDDRIIPDLWVNEELHELFKNPDRHWVLQNAKFDMRMLGYRGISIEGHVLDDVVLARVNRNDHFGGRAYSLDAQAKRHGWSKDDRVMSYIKEHGLYAIRKDFFGREYKQPQFDKVPVDLMEQYACQDARLTYDLFSIYVKQFDADDRKIVENETALTKVCFSMERTGMMLNKDYTLKALHYERGQLEAAREGYAAITGNNFVNSAKAISPHLDNYKLPTTDAGNESLTDDVLEAIISDGSERARSVASLVQKIRTHDKRISTYYENYLCMVTAAGVIHPDMQQAGTRTGRFSYRDPNLQNVPKEEESTATYVIRGCFMPRPGHVYVSFDYSQMEYRMMAAYAGEMGVIEQVMGGVDFHEATAKLFGVSRKHAKTLNFAILYGAGEEKLAYMLGISRSEARTLKLKYFMALPKVERFIDTVIRTGKSRGYVKNWLGRKLYSDPKFAYALPNHLIQGGGADVVKVAMNKIYNEYPEMGMVLQVHDQLVFDVHPSNFGKLTKIKEIMENAFPPMNGMRLTVDVSHSKVSLAERDMEKGFPC